MTLGHPVSHKTMRDECGWTLAWHISHKAAEKKS